jgi:hypothetical protein
MGTPPGLPSREEKVIKMKKNLAYACVCEKNFIWNCNFGTPLPLRMTTSLLVAFKIYKPS